jgi:hypothetical protein
VVLIVDVRAGYLLAGRVARVGDRDLLACEEDADLALCVPQDRVAPGDRDDHGYGFKVRL